MTLVEADEPVIGADSEEAKSRVRAVCYGIGVCAVCLAEIHYNTIPVVPRKAVAEVSKIGNL